MIHRCVFRLFLLPLGLLAAAGPEAMAEPGGAGKLPRITASTFAERNAADPLNDPPTEDTLVIPFPSEYEGFRPFRNPKGEKDPRFSQVFENTDTAQAIRINQWVWGHLPWSAKTEAYLARRAEFERQAAAEKDPKKSLGLRRDLAGWCDAQGLTLCAAYEARLAVLGRTDYHDPVFKSFHRYFLKHMDYQQTAYSFPLPVEGEWLVIVDRTGHHRIKPGAAYAFDLVIERNGSDHKSSGRRLEDYYCYDQPVIAQGDGMVVTVANDNPDVPPGQSGGFGYANQITIDYGGGVRALYGHLKKGSIPVQVGDMVKRGQELGRIGNSGASGIPHLHFAMLNQWNSSVPGRYFCEERKHGRRNWEEIEGRDLTEGTFVRNAIIPLIEERTWTNTEGRTILAAVISADTETVKLKLSDGKLVDYPIAQLSEPDQERVRQLEGK